MIYQIRLVFLLLFLFTGISSFSSEREKRIRQFIENELKWYSKARLQDLYKNYFQDAFGPGHLIPDTSGAAAYLDWELRQPGWTDTVSYQPLGINNDYYRINLSLVKNGTIPRDTLLLGMVRSAPLARHPDIESWKKEWAEVVGIIQMIKPGLPGLKSDERMIARLLEKGEVVMHHSKQYEKAYHPHYRIIHRSVFTVWKEKYLK